MEYQLGKLHVYHGDGKGKTTAALGLALRALGAGFRVLLIQFMKEASYSEHRVLEGLHRNLEVMTLGKPYFVAREDEWTKRELLDNRVVVFPPGQPPADYVAMLRRGLERAREAVGKGSHDLIILDEANVALHYGLLPREEVLELVDGRSSRAELVFTGRYPPRELLERADLITEMREERHYFRQGVRNRPGVDC